MKVTIDNMKSLQAHMQGLQQDMRLGRTSSIEVRERITHGCLKPFGYTLQYHVIENDQSFDRPVLMRMIGDAIETWRRMSQAVETWLRYQEYSRSADTNDYIASRRKMFEPKLDQLERQLRLVIEFCGDSVDKPGR